ncbi:MAG: SWIM zinc finger family protein [Proteobacteria bacterium]|nr:SWIM zinc finger family protein [Pseudomonadota bacterium]
MTGAAAASELIKLAGQGAYERGVAYYEEGRVARLSVVGDRITARVDGTEAYEVRLRKTSLGFDGACTCPASEGFDFCKHCVAVALAVEARDAVMQSTAADPAADRIRAYLSGLSSDALIDIVLGALDEAPELENRLLMQADVAAGALDAKRLKKMITAAMPLRDLWDYRQVAQYFERAEACMTGIDSIAPSLAPADLLAAVRHAFSRLDKALGRVDDSGGRRWGLQYGLHALHRNALARSGWAADDLASYLLDLQLKDPWDTFNDILDEYGELLGDDGRAAYIANVKLRLDELPDLPFGASFDEKYPYIRLTGILAEAARAAGDRDVLIELARRTCTSARDCYGIAELYLEQGNADRALAWLDKGDAAADERSRDHSLRASVHRAREEWAKAADAQLELFKRSPGVGQFRELEELAARAGRGEQIKQLAVDYLRSGLDGDRWHGPACGVTLAAILHADGVIAEAVELVNAYARNPQDLVDAAGWFAENDPGQAAEFVARAIEAHIQRKNKSGYRQAVDLLIEQKELFDRAGENRFNGFVGELRARHKPKRNLQALLNNIAATATGKRPKR